MSQFFWNLMLAGIVVLIATRVAVVLDREPTISISVKWAILVGVVLASAVLLSLVRLAAP